MWAVTATPTIVRSMQPPNPYEASSHGSLPSSTSTRLSTPVALTVIAAFQVVLLIAAILLRKHQLSLPDPYNNPYTNWSTICFLSSMTLWLAGVGWSITRTSRRAPLSLFVWVWLVLSTAYVAWVLINLMRFMAPL